MEEKELFPREDSKWMRKALDEAGKARLSREEFDEISKTFKTLYSGGNLLDFSFSLRGRHVKTMGETVWVDGLICSRPIAERIYNRFYPIIDNLSLDQKASGVEPQAGEGDSLGEDLLN